MFIEPASIHVAENGNAALPHQQKPDSPQIFLGSFHIASNTFRECDFDKKEF
jgi:hypothetical protein